MLPDVVRTETPSADDLQNYIEAFKASSDRARYALYVMVIATVIVASINYSFQPWSWPMRRINAWYGNAAEIPQGTPAAKAQEERLKQVANVFFGGNVEQLKTARDEYLKQFTSRLVFNASPIPGISIDCNDLGIVGGIALVLLALVLTLSINREHENLYLALYKVRRLCSIPGEDHSRGDSRANLLYHALAMSQALSSPPTLAQWRRRGILHHFGLILFLPVGVYAWVLKTNWDTYDIGKNYGANMTRILAVQIGFAILLLLLNITAYLHSRAMAKRWERAFFRINPGRQHVRPMKSWEWLRLPTRGSSDQTRRVVTELVDTLRGPDTSTIGSVSVEDSIEIAAGSSPLTNIHIKEMAEKLANKGQARAEGWCKDRGVFQNLLHFSAEENLVRGRTWSVRGNWTFGYTPALQGESVRPEPTASHQTTANPTSS